MQTRQAPKIIRNFESALSQQKIHAELWTHQDHLKILYVTIFWKLQKMTTKKALEIKGLQVKWRRGWDLNPRTDYESVTRFRVGRVTTGLRYLSARFLEIFFSWRRRWKNSLKRAEQLSASTP